MNHWRLHVWRGHSFRSFCPICIWARCLLTLWQWGNGDHQTAQELVYWNNPWLAEQWQDARIRESWSSWRSRNACCFHQFNDRKSHFGCWICRMSLSNASWISSKGHARSRGSEISVSRKTGILLIYACDPRYMRSFKRLKYHLSECKLNWQHFYKDVHSCLNVSLSLGVLLRSDIWRGIPSQFTAILPQTKSNDLSTPASQPDLVANVQKHTGP